MAIALCGAAATLALAVGHGADDNATTSASSSVTVTPPPSPTPADPGGAFPAVPAGGGACIIGLNCGCIPRITCPTPRRHPGPAGPGHDAGRSNP
jgi:hypothetical protein